MENRLKKLHKSGFDNRVHMHRAKPKHYDKEIEEDPNIMVQDEIARLKFFSEQINFTEKMVLDIGCGTGYCCDYAFRRLGSRKVLGIDISPSTIEFARQLYRNCQFELGDVSDPAIDLGVGKWDIIICCEVFEHIEPSKAETLLSNILKHLNKSGVAFVSTPNIDVFSLGFSPSPHNQTHLREYNLSEFDEILRSVFPFVKIWGQRFKSTQQFEQYCSATRRNIIDYKILGRYYWNRWIRVIWKFIRFEWLYYLKGNPWIRKHEDFDFIHPVIDDSLWFCAILKKEKI